MTENKNLVAYSQEKGLINESTKNAFEVVEQLNKISLITPKDIATLKKSQVFLLSTYTDVPAFRTFVEKYVGVLTNTRFPTPDSKFWQCKKEAEVQFNELLKALLHHRAVLIDIEEVKYKTSDLESKKDKSEHPFLTGCDIARFDVKLAELQIHLKGIEKEIKYRIAEIGDWNDISNEWSTDMKFSKDVYSQHEVQAMLGYLKKEIANSVAKNDESAAKVLASQLDTLNSFIQRKIEKAMKRSDEATP